MRADVRGRPEPTTATSCAVMHRRDARHAAEVGVESRRGRCGRQVEPQGVGDAARVVEDHLLVVALAGTDDQQGDVGLDEIAVEEVVLWHGSLRWRSAPHGRATLVAYAPPSAQGGVVVAEPADPDPGMSSTTAVDSTVRPVDLRDYVTFADDSATRVRVHETDVVAQDLWCIQPQQATEVLQHDTADIVYTVLGGRSWFVTDQGEIGLDPLASVLIPAGVVHGIDNVASTPIVSATVAPPARVAWGFRRRRTRWQSARTTTRRRPRRSSRRRASARPRRAVVSDVRSMRGRRQSAHARTRMQRGRCREAGAATGRPPTSPSPSPSR